MKLRTLTAHLLTALFVEHECDRIGRSLCNNLPYIDAWGQIVARYFQDAKKGSWEMPALFTWLQAQGNVAESEMYKTFNCGIGMVVIVSKDQVKATIDLLKAEGEQVFEIGFVRKQQTGEPPTVVV